MSQATLAVLNIILTDTGLLTIAQVLAAGTNADNDIAEWFLAELSQANIEGPGGAVWRQRAKRIGAVDSVNWSFIVKQIRKGI